MGLKSPAGKSIVTLGHPPASVDAHVDEVIGVQVLEPGGLRVLDELRGDAVDAEGHELIGREVVDAGLHVGGQQLAHPQTFFEANQPVLRLEREDPREERRQDEGKRHRQGPQRRRPWRLPDAVCRQHQVHHQDRQQHVMKERDVLRMTGVALLGHRLLQGCVRG